jgi:hypothetical protein
MSVMEMSHRGKQFMGIAAEAEADLRELLKIPDNYKVCCMHADPARSSMPRLVLARSCSIAKQVGIRRCGVAATQLPLGRPSFQCDQRRVSAAQRPKVHGRAQVLFMQGGASAQFAAVPLNLTQQGDTVDHVVTGSWSKKAVAEAEKFCNVNIAAKVRRSARFAGRAGAGKPCLALHAERSSCLRASTAMERRHGTASGPGPALAG